MNFVNPAAVGAIAVPPGVPAKPAHPIIAVHDAAATDGSVDAAATDGSVDGAVDVAVEGAVDGVATTEGSVDVADVAVEGVVAIDTLDNRLVINNYIIEGINTACRTMKHVDGQLGAGL